MAQWMQQRLGRNLAPHRGWDYLQRLGLSSRLAHRQHAKADEANQQEVVNHAGITWRLARLWQCTSFDEVRALERKLKRWYGGAKLCSLCLGLLVDDLVFMRHGTNASVARSTGKASMPYAW